MGKRTNNPISDLDSKPVIHLQLDKFHFALSSNSRKIESHTRQLFGDWLTQPNELEAARASDVQIHLEIVESLPGLPDYPPIFVDNITNLPDGVGTLCIYEQLEGFLFYFKEGGLVQIKSGMLQSRLIRGKITTKLLQYGRLHDLIFTSLSSYLRRQGYFLVHASAAVNNQGASIFVGPPGCGKSTTALNLALNGWGVLSNDTLLLQERPDGIYALPTPGGFSIRPESFNHIPGLSVFAPLNLPGDFNHLPLSKLGLTWAEPALISAIYFPEINVRPENHLQPISPAISLAHLMELSLDRWDKSSLADHITFLEKLNYQAKSARLVIGNQQQLPDRLILSE